MVRKQRFGIGFKVFILAFLLIFLGGVAAASWIKNEYDSAREETIREIEDSGGTVDENNEIEFNPSVNEDDESKDSMRILLVVLDDNEGIARTDTIMIGKYIPETGEAKLVSIMRDTYVDIPGRGKNKINASFAFGGLDLLRETIEENFDFPVEYYAQVNFDSFERVVDTLAPEGLTVDVEKRMYYQDGAGSLTIDFDSGEQTMNGEEALKYVRFRNDSENDFGRVRRQQQMMSILQEELLSLSGVMRIPQILGSIEPYIQTNLGNQQLVTYGRDYLSKSAEGVETLTIPVEDGFSHEYYSHAGAVLELDYDKNRQALHDFFGSTQENTDDEETHASGEYDQ